ncbi:hypothetical protein FQN55_004099 [Onygenales sp. PD_40]|nr:hypothetical protein FQN55_004099 [Onygenales sp. PD_40]KAK2775714.1 hypothetical protein FQN52_003968 [Onygenales sp. PD_12]KAK2795857.1 hypothetical protein FQN51_000340 [Onygenales sp. PD_10]
MTDTSSLAATHSTETLPSVTVHPLPSPVLNGNGAQSVHEEDDEPYTIKCICGFADDDGHTVFCERCETWQHILCYYDGQDVPEVHNCADCEPRPLDSKLATELQRKRREQSDGGDRKGRRQASKSQRRKKDPAEQTNGWSSHERSASNSTSRDHPPPAKRPKTSHRASNSVSSLTAIPVIAPEGRKRATSTSNTSMSPIKSSVTPTIPLYSQEFLHLYDRDQANDDIPSNLFDTLKLATDLSSWVQDKDALDAVTNGRNATEVFTRLDAPLDPSRWPTISKQSLTQQDVEYDGKHPSWRFLTVESDVHKDQIIGEVKGKVGHFRDYCLDPNSRWKDLRHPEPFVFFHPQLPIYIDSRKEGSQLRYIRRSCRPNVTMKTFITNDTEYHFCFVANQEISAKSEITTSWYLDPQIFPSNGIVKQEGPNDGVSDVAAACISNVLSNFGGCACDSSGRPCRLAKIDCRQRPKPLEPTKQMNGRRKKSKAKNIISPVNTGPATDSRAGSEIGKVHEDDERLESRSTSTSRDHPRSRDLTPTSHSPTDLVGSTTGELSAREKRKIAAAEKKFEQLEQDQQHPQKKKKRNSGVSQSKTPRLETANSRRSSSSPRKRSPMSATPRGSQKKPSRSSTPSVGSPLRHPHYVDSQMQTDPDENDPDFVPPKPPPRSPYVPLTMRLFKRSHEDRLRLQELRNLNITSPTQSNMSPQTQISHATGRIQSRDVEMKNADTSMTPPKNHPSTSHELTLPDHSPSSKHAHPLPSTVAHTRPLDGPRGDLRVQLPPPFSNSAQSVNTPSPTIVQSPFNVRPGVFQLASHTPGSTVAGPSPAKKKLSLGDYMSRRGTLTTPTAEKPPPPIFPSSQVQASQSSQSPNGSPLTDKASGDEQKHDHTSADVVMQDAPAESAVESPSGSAGAGSRDPRLQPRQ